jgi:hypothetical protein
MRRVGGIEWSRRDHPLDAANSKTSVGWQALSVLGISQSTQARNLLKLAVGQLCDRRATVTDALNSLPV